MFFHLFVTLIEKLIQDIIISLVLVQEVGHGAVGTGLNILKEKKECALKSVSRCLAEIRALKVLNTNLCPFILPSLFEKKIRPLHKAKRKCIKTLLSKAFGI